MHINELGMYHIHLQFGQVMTNFDGISFLPIMDNRGGSRISPRRGGQLPSGGANI